MHKWNYDSQINTASAITFSTITVGIDCVKSVKNYVIKHSAKQLGGSQVTRVQSGLN